jgi:hypothetical protein
LRADHRRPSLPPGEPLASLPDTLDDSSHPSRKLRTAFRSRAAASAAADAAMGHLRIPAPDWSAFDRASAQGTLPAFPTPPPRPPGPVHPDRGPPPKHPRSQRHPSMQVCHAAAPTTAPTAAPLAAAKSPKSRPPSSAQRLRAALGAKSPVPTAPDAAAPETPTPTTTPPPVSSNPASATPAHPADTAPAPSPPATAVPRPARRLGYAAKLRQKSFGVYA